MHIISNSHFGSLKAMAASKQPRRWFDLRFEIRNLYYMLYMCMLPLTAILVASEAMGASKWPPRSLLTLNLNCLIMITYVPTVLWPLYPVVQVQEKKKAKHDPLTCVASPQVQMAQICPKCVHKVSKMCLNFGHIYDTFWTHHFQWKNFTNVSKMCP